MLWKKTNRFWKIGFIAINAILMVNISGCGNVPQKETQNIENKSEVQIFTQGNSGEEKIVKIYRNFYEKFAAERPESDLEMIRSIVSYLGEKGYTAIDSRSQVDMVCREQVIQFCEKVDAKKEDKLTIVEAIYLGAFAIYDLQTKDGNVNVVKSYYEYENNDMVKRFTGTYTADDWNYTEDGYLMFSGAWFSEELYVLTLSGAEEHIAFRVQPLEEKCRELNRKYLFPISYERNNMFLRNWCEEDFGELDFYDLYDIFYPEINRQPVPYAADDNLGVGAVYKIPRDEFERVIMTYFNIDSGTLQSKTTYYPEDATYEYKPRGFYEVEYPEYPYPEVVGFTENSDGTITLMVHAVFPYAGVSKAYVHEVVVRPLEGGGVQYVSNRIIPSENNYEETWHTPRLTKEEWKEVYGGYE